MPRWLLMVVGLSIYLVVLPLIHGVLPWAVSLLTPHYGWTDGGPGLWNWPGLLPVCAGAAGLYWIMVVGLLNWHRVPERVEIGVPVPHKLRPPFLLRSGPYGFSRNPMYVFILLLWLGWTVFLGSLAVLVGLAVLGTTMMAIVPREERALEAQFGGEFAEFRARVPRWLGVPRRSG
jgi:protein-S-isoprenylcysteine O-methyltransferase Ste14